MECKKRAKNLIVFLNNLNIGNLFVYFIFCCLVCFWHIRFNDNRAQMVNDHFIAQRIAFIILLARPSFFRFDDGRPLYVYARLQTSFIYIASVQWHTHSRVWAESRGVSPSAAFKQSGIRANGRGKISPAGVIWLRSRRCGAGWLVGTVGLEVRKDGGWSEEASGVSRAIIVGWRGLRRSISRCTRKEERHEREREKGRKRKRTKERKSFLGRRPISAKKKNA